MDLRLRLRHGGAPLVLLALLVVSLLSLGAATASAGPPAQAQPLRVVTKPLKPFVIKSDEKLEGFSIELWDEVARRIGVSYRWVEVQTVTDQLKAIQSGAADVAIAGISMTSEREKVVDFSHPFFNAGLQILVPSEGDNSLTSLISVILSPQLLQILALGAGIWVVMAHLIWIIERFTNPSFPKGYLPGVWEGLWWSTGLLAAGNYGPDEPQGVVRRIAAIVWIFVGIILIAQFTASVTSLLTVQQLNGSIRGPEDLPGKTIATVTGSTAAQYLDAHKLSYLPVTAIEDAYALLDQHKAQAVVYDAPVLLYYAVSEGKGKAQVVGRIFREEGYGIALPPGSSYRKAINEALLQIRQDGTYDTLYQRWFAVSP